MTEKTKSNIEQKKSESYRKKLRNELEKSGANLHIDRKRTVLIENKKKKKLGNKAIYYSSGIFIFLLILGLATFKVVKNSSEGEKKLNTSSNSSSQSVQELIEKNNDLRPVSEDRSNFSQDRNEIFNIKKYEKISNDDLVNFSEEEKEKIRNVLINYSISEDLRNKAKDPNYSVSSLYSHAQDILSIISGKNADLITQGYYYDYPLEINNFSVVTRVNMYSKPWNLGVNQYDKLIGINGSKINPNARLEDVQAAMFDSRISTLNWLHTKTNTSYTTPSFKQEVDFDSLATIHQIDKNTISVHIKKLTNYTPTLITKLLSNYVNGKTNLIIDLRGTTDFSYIGTPELVWLFNHQQIKNIAQITDQNGSVSYLKSEPFSLDRNLADKINNMNKIIAVDQNTAGSAEIITKNINGLINGYTTKGDNRKFSYFRLNNNSLIQISNNIVKDPNGNNIQVIPKQNKFLPFNY